MRWIKSAGLRRPKTLTAWAPTGTAELGAGLGGGRAVRGRRNSLGRSSPSFSLPRRPRQGAGAAQVTGSRYPRGWGWSPDSPAPSRSRNWGSRGGDGATGKSLLPLLSSRSLSPLPSASAWEIWALQSHTRARGFAGGIFKNLNFQSAPGGWEAEEERRDFYIFDWQCRPLGWQGKKEKKSSLVRFGPPPAE